MKSSESLIACLAQFPALLRTGMYTIICFIGTIVTRMGMYTIYLFYGTYYEVLTER